MLKPSSTRIALLVALCGLCRAAQLQWGNTTLTGQDTPILNQEFFGGIPFAQAPIGALRLQPPVPRLSLSDSTFDATHYGPGCIQPLNELIVPADGLSEDCLTINVLRPAAITPDSKLPVLAWVYGGGFLIGEANTYNGSIIVGQSITRGTPVIFVNFNYRLGPLGFPQGQEASDKKVLNLGLLDQIAALQWIQANISAFGGDPTKVTVFGESAGAISIAINTLRPSFAQLARAVILESGHAATTIANYAATRSGVWDAFVSAIPACNNTVGTNTTIDCLQSVDLDAATLTGAIGAGLSSTIEQYPFVPTLDDDVYPALPSLIYASGNWAKIPFIAGTNLDEGTSFIGDPSKITTLTAEQLLLSNFNPSLIPGPIGSALLNSSIGPLLKLYPDEPALGSPFGTGNNTFDMDGEFKRVAALVGDLRFQAQRRLLQQLTSAQGVTSYGYLFTDPQPQSPPWMGVSHSVEIAYVFGSWLNAGPGSRPLSASIIDYWLSFAVSLDPNDGKGTERPQWPQYTPTNQVLLELNGNKTSVIPDDYRKAQIEFINANSVVYHARRND